MNTSIAAAIASMLNMLFVAFLIFGESLAFGFFGFVAAVTWLLFERKKTHEELSRRRWKGTLIAAACGVAAYIVCAVIAIKQDPSGGRAMFALIIGFMFIVPSIFGVPGTVMRLLVRK